MSLKLIWIDAHVGRLKFKKSCYLETISTNIRTPHPFQILTKLYNALSRDCLKHINFGNQTFHLLQNIVKEPQQPFIIICFNLLLRIKFHHHN